MACGETYRELHRPQFHFTPKKDWMNDPNGLVFYKGEYHLFFQYTPDSVRHGPNTWGHAVSTDLVRWEQIEHAIEPDEYGWIWSGSAVVDWNNTAGLKEGDEDTIVAIYTIGGFGDPPNPCVQSISYSNDRGRTFTMYDGNPVLGHIRAANRDPKVIWHKPTQTWIMALYLDANDYTFYGSKDLKKWDHLCDLAVPGTSECPDFFPLAVDGDPRTSSGFCGARPASTPSARSTAPRSCPRKNHSSQSSERTATRRRRGATCPTTTDVVAGAFRPRGWRADNIPRCRSTSRCRSPSN